MSDQYEKTEFTKIKLPRNFRTCKLQRKIGEEEALFEQECEHVMVIKEENHRTDTTRIIKLKGPLRRTRLALKFDKNGH